MHERKQQRQKCVLIQDYRYLYSNDVTKAAHFHDSAFVYLLLSVPMPAGVASTGLIHSFFSKIFLVPSGRVTRRLQNKTQFGCIIKFLLEDALV